MLRWKKEQRGCLVGGGFYCTRGELVFCCGFSAGFRRVSAVGALVTWAVAEKSWARLGRDGWCNLVGAQRNLDGWDAWHWVVGDRCSVSTGRDAKRNASRPRRSIRYTCTVLNCTVCTLQNKVRMTSNDNQSF